MPVQIGFQEFFKGHQNPVRSRFQEFFNLLSNKSHHSPDPSAISDTLDIGRILSNY